MLKPIKYLREKWHLPQTDIEMEFAAEIERFQGSFYLCTICIPIKLNLILNLVKPILFFYNKGSNIWVKINKANSKQYG